MFQNLIGNRNPFSQIQQGFQNLAPLGGRPIGQTAETISASRTDPSKLMGLIFPELTEKPNAGETQKPNAAPTVTNNRIQSSDRAQPQSALPPTFRAAIDRTEGAGDYDTLFGHAQRSGRFAGTRVSQMPIREVLNFASPSGAYGQHVKRQVGRVATPMGRHQIVGTTLRNAVKEMGLDPETPFSADVQDAIAMHLARKRVQSANTTQGKIRALRSEWEGFKHLPDQEVAKIVAEIEGSAPVELASIAPGGQKSPRRPAGRAREGQPATEFGAKLETGLVKPSDREPGNYFQPPSSGGGFSAPEVAQTESEGLDVPFEDQGMEMIAGIQQNPHELAARTMAQRRDFSQLQNMDFGAKIEILKQLNRGGSNV